MAGHICALNGEYLNHHTFRIARTQREVGLDRFGWEGRLKPLRPISYDVAAGIGVVASVGLMLLLI
ncbi:MAG TPA: hypothetical protein VNY75_11035 [Rhizomicrobium sp.]|jgi:hypothetical protein|nr:hypothetical protein [Rhizomicrobium sp.]